MRRESTIGNRRGTQEFSAGTRPLPVFRFDHEFSADGVRFDVEADALEFSGVSDPVVEGLVLPKRLADAVQGRVGVPRGYSFHNPRDFREGQTRLQQDMNMVGHDDIGVQFIAAKFSATQDGVCLLYTSPSPRD